MEENVLKPQIRFKGFTDVWEQRKLGDIIKSQSIDIDPNPESFAKYEVIQQGNEPIAGYSNRNPFKDYEPMVLFGDHTLSLYKPKSPFLVASDGVKAYFLDNVDGNYFYHLLSTNLPKNEGYKRYSSILKDKDIKLTYNKKEEVKISALFDNLDSLITLHQRKYERLQAIKKGLLEKMFPAEGDDKPKIRFKGFTDVWEQHKLGDIVQITMGQSPDGSTYSDIPSDYILVQGNADLVDGWVSPRVWTTQKTKTCSAGDLIMSVRAPAGAMGKTAYDAVIGRGVASIKGNEFIFQQLSKMDNDGFWRKDSSGSTFESLNSDSIKNAEICLPKGSEQIKIGNFFKDLDSLITLHQREHSH